MKSLSLKKKIMNKHQTLAQLISDRREDIGYTQKGLADRANIDLYMVESIEAGHELFLPPTVRQKLAMALKISPKTIKALEKQPEEQEPDYDIELLKIKILNEGLKGHKCPQCGSDLVCRVAVMYDLEDNMVREPKARCSKCPFYV